jgi:hypothetical protein
MADDVTIEITEMRITSGADTAFLRRTFIDPLRRSEVGWALSDADGHNIAMFTDDALDAAKVAAFRLLSVKKDAQALRGQADQLEQDTVQAIVDSARPDPVKEPPEPLPVPPLESADEVTP